MIFIFVLLLIISAQGTASYLVDSTKLQNIDKIWNARKSGFAAYIQSDFAKHETYVLYNIQSYTQNLLEMAILTKNISLLDEIATLYMAPYSYLEKKSDCTVPYNQIGTKGPFLVPLSPPARMWVDYTDTAWKAGIEDVLTSAQFTYALTRLMNGVSQIPESSWTTGIRNFVSSYDSVLVHDHYERWVYGSAKKFGRRAWGGAAGVFDHFDHLRNELNYFYGSKYTHLNAVEDVDLWIIAGVTELLGANKRMPDRLRIDSLLARKFQTYLNTGYALCASRMVAKTVTNFDGKQVSGRIFEPGAWSDYKDHAYAGYSGDSYPDTNINKLKVAGVGWDISHGRRFVSVFNSLYRERTFSGHSFPTDSDMQGLANQVVYGISNKDRKFPLFTNFSDSSNGWYRVGYHGAGSGHAPYGLCNSITSGGYGFWAEYNSDLGLVMDTLWHICQSVVAGVKTGTLGSLVVNTKINTIDASFYKEYYMGSRYYFEYVKSPPSLSTLDLELLHFLPTLGKWKNDYSSSESDCMSSDKVNCLEISSSNPFNASLRLKFKVSGQSFVSMKIYTASGRLVRTLVNSNNVYDGAHNTIWDGCDDSGQQLPSGSYLCRLSINGQKTAKRVILIR